MPPVKRSDNFYGIPEYYDHYLEMIKKGNMEGAHVSAQVFHDVLDEFNKTMRDKILFDAYEWELPAGMGKLAVYRYIKKIIKKKDGSYNLPISWRKTFALWDRDPEARAAKKKIYAINSTKNRYTYKIFFLKGTSKFKNRSAYRFKAVSPFRKAVRQIALDPMSIYPTEHFMYDIRYTN